MRAWAGRALGLGVLSLGATAPALASDPRRAPLQPPVLVDDFSSGWYWRGDLFQSIALSPRFAYQAGGAHTAFGDQRSEATLGFGIGAGFKYKAFRTDVTIDTRGGRNVSGLSPRGAAPGAFATRDEAKLTTSTALWNVYWDIGYFTGFTPYVGAGVGVAHQRLSGWTVAPIATGDPVGASPGFAGARYSLAYALMAGFSADITPQTKVDFGYRFVSHGGGRFADGAVDAARLTSGLQQSHELRIGVRHMFGDAAPEPIASRF